MVVLSCLSLHLQGQGIVSNVYTGYAFGCSFDAYENGSDYYKNTIDGSFKYGLDLGYKIDRSFSVDLSLQYQNTKMPVEAHNNGNNISQILNLALLWIMVGGTSYLPANHFEFFLVLTSE